MPWKEVSVMDERMKFIGRLLSGEKMAPLCREFGTSRNNQAKSKGGCECYVNNVNGEKTTGWSIDSLDFCRMKNHMLSQHVEDSSPLSFRLWNSSPWIGSHFGFTESLAIP